MTVCELNHNHTNPQPAHPRHHGNKQQLKIIPFLNPNQKSKNHEHPIITTDLTKQVSAQSARTHCRICDRQPRRG